MAEQTIDYLQQAGERPFFLFSGFYSPHSPWVAPQEFLDLYDPDELPLPPLSPELDARRTDTSFSDAELRSVRHGYYAMISEVDHHVGRILETLEARGLADNTVVVFTSDHGEWLGEHLRYGKGHWAPDCISRVPLIVRAPNAIPEAGKVVHDIVECIDIVPTLLTAAGIPIPRGLQGNCLLPALTDDCLPDDGLGLTEYTGWKSLRAPGLRYVSEANGQEALYDLATDPAEYCNVAANPAYAAQTLRDAPRPRPTPHRHGAAYRAHLAVLKRFADAPDGRQVRSEPTARSHLTFTVISSAARDLVSPEAPSRSRLRQSLRSFAVDGSGPGPLRRPDLVEFLDLQVAEPDEGTVSEESEVALGAVESFVFFCRPWWLEYWLRRDRRPR